MTNGVWEGGFGRYHQLLQNKFFERRSRFHEIVIVTEKKKKKKRDKNGENSSPLTTERSTYR